MAQKYFVVASSFPWSGLSLSYFGRFCNIYLNAAILIIQKPQFTAEKQMIACDVTCNTCRHYLLDTRCGKSQICPVTTAWLSATLLDGALFTGDPSFHLSNDLALCLPGVTSIWVFLTLSHRPVVTISIEKIIHWGVVGLDITPNSQKKPKGLYGHGLLGELFFQFLRVKRFYHCR